MNAGPNVSICSHPCTVDKGISAQISLTANMIDGEIADGAVRSPQVFITCKGFTEGLVGMKKAVTAKERALGSAIALPAMSLVSPGNLFQIALVFTVLGFVISPTWVLPTALIANVVDYGSYKGSGQQEGLYMSFYNFAIKVVGLWLPAALLLPGASPLWSYLLNARRHGVIVRRLANRSSV